MTQQRAEAWRPPTFTPPSKTFVSRWIATLRRMFDLQAGSIWNDLAILLPDRSGTVLDVGCGAQPYRELVGSNTKYIGIDTADAKSQFGYDIPDTIYFTGSVWPIDDRTVDVVLCTETLEHVPNTDDFIAQIARVLRPGGSLILTVPFAARYHYIPNDYFRFTPAALQLLLSRAGLVEVAVFARGNAVTVACYKIMALILPLFFSQRSTTLRAFCLIVAIVLTPLLAMLAAIANLSLLGQGGNDCLGYTVLARQTSPATVGGSK